MVAIDSFSILFSHRSSQKPAVSPGFLVVFQEKRRPGKNGNGSYPYKRFSEEKEMRRKALRSFLALLTHSFFPKCPVLSDPQRRVLHHLEPEHPHDARQADESEET